LISRVCFDFGNHLIAPRPDDGPLLTELDRLSHSPASYQRALCDFLGAHAAMCVAQARLEKQERDAMRDGLRAPAEPAPVPDAPGYPQLWEN
jgi:hypothetical protein